MGLCLCLCFDRTKDGVSWEVAMVALAPLFALFMGRGEGGGLAENEGLLAAEHVKRERNMVLLADGADVFKEQDG